MRGDLLDEINENYLVNLSGPVNATIADGQGVGTITDDDAPPALSVNDVTVTEGNTGTVNANFTVSLNVPSGRAVTVDFATANGTAQAPADYQAGSGTVTFAAGQTTKQVTVLVNGDLLDEANETYFVNLTNPTNATISDGQGVGTITDDDAPPALSVNDVTVTEGNTGTVNANFTVSLNVPSGRAVTVDFATANGTAQAPADYQAGSGTVTFAPGQTSKQVTVLVNGDLLDEANETYFVNLTNPTNATISDGQGVGTITDDDPMPALSVGDVTVIEGDAGTVDATFTVTLNAPSGRERLRRLRDRGRHRAFPGRLRRAERPARLHAGPDVEAGHGPGQGRHARRDERDVLPEPDECGQRDDSGRAGSRHDHRRRRRPLALDRRRVRDRGERRHGGRHVHGHPRAYERPNRHRRLRDRERDGDRRQRLPGPERHADLRARSPGGDADSAGLRRHASSRATRPSS